MSLRRSGFALIIAAFLAGFANIHVAGTHGWAYSGFMFWAVILFAFGTTLIYIDETFNNHDDRGNHHED